MPCGKQAEWENIQRRIYDIINVLIAVGCVERLKDKRIAYKGFNEIEVVETETKKVLIEIYFIRKKLRSLL